jgi:hypothetical protein
MFSRATRHMCPVCTLLSVAARGCALTHFENAVWLEVDGWLHFLQPCRCPETFLSAATNIPSRSPSRSATRCAAYQRKAKASHDRPIREACETEMIWYYARGPTPARWWRATSAGRLPRAKARRRWLRQAAGKAPRQCAARIRGRSHARSSSRKARMRSPVGRWRARRMTAPNISPACGSATTTSTHMERAVTKTSTALNCP